MQSLTFLSALLTDFQHFQRQRFASNKEKVLRKPAKASESSAGSNRDVLRVLELNLTSAIHRFQLTLIPLNSPSPEAATTAAAELMRKYLRGKFKISFEFP